MRAIRYSLAIEWVCLNDCTEWLRGAYGSISVTACLVADIYGKTDEQVTADMKKWFERKNKEASYGSQPAA